MTELHRNLRTLLVLRLVQIVKQELAETIAAGQFEDMGYDDCDTCRRARLRQSFSA